MTTLLKLKRAYEEADAADGYRVYVDRIWPRGLSHLTFHYDAWDKEIAPSAALRNWFHANRDANWAAFEERYAAELKASAAVTALVGDLASHPVATLLYSSKNQMKNNAVVLRDFLLDAYPGRFRS